MQGTNYDDDDDDDDDDVDDDYDGWSPPGIQSNPFNTGTWTLKGLKSGPTPPPPPKKM